MSRPSFQVVRAYLWPLLLLITLFLASGMPHLAAPEIELGLPRDKVLHFLFFGLLATSIIRTPCFQRGSLLQIAVVILLGASLGGLDEFRQSFTPGREVELHDWYANVLGTVVAVIAYTKWPLYRRLLEWKHRQT